MYFLSKKISDFIKAKTGVGDNMWQGFQQDYIYTMQIYLEIAVNNYLDKQTDKSELEKFKQLAEKDKSGYEVIERLWKMYAEIDEVREYVDEQMQKYTETLLGVFITSIGEDSRKEFSQLLDSEIDRYSGARKSLDKILANET